jgi:hypothetical protein
MKHLLLLGIPLLAVSACTPPPPPAPVAQPVSTPAPANTTSAFDGTYGNPIIGAKSPPGCPDLGFAPNLTIRNGLALLQGPNLTFQGYVTPQGVLAMSSTTGQTFQGQIDPQFVLRSHVTGPNCAYDVTWTRVS